MAGLISNFALTPLFTSRTQLYIIGKTSAITSLTDIQLGTQLTQDYMVLVKSRPVVNKVIENLGLDMSYESMLGHISISNPTNTRILEIQVEYPDAYLAKEIVDELQWFPPVRLQRSWMFRTDNCGRGIHAD
jgi:capsular polysaccharide biosynthesis protein